MIELGTNQPLAATCARGLEMVLADELRAIGAAAVAPDRGSVLFSGDLRTVYDVNLRLRTAMRVLVPLVRGEVKARESLYELAESVAWEEVIADGQTFAVEADGTVPFGTPPLPVRSSRMRRSIASATNAADAPTSTVTNPTSAFTCGW
jgi:hypothetical protein